MKIFSEFCCLNKKNNKLALKSFQIINLVLGFFRLKKILNNNYSEILNIAFSSDKSNILSDLFLSPILR